MRYLFAAIAALMVILLFIQVSPLVIYKKWRDLGVYLFFWVTATTYALLVAADAPIPTVNEIVINTVESVFRTFR